MKTLAFDNVNLNSALGKPILQGIICRFQSSEFTVITGPNASGKTSLAHLMCGQSKPNSGTIRNNSRVAYCDQEPSTRFLAQSVRDEIGYSLSRRSLGTSLFQQRIDEAITWAGLAGRESEHIGNLALSEKRLVSIAAAWAARPDFYILDEPLANLDRNSVCQIIQLCIELVRQGSGVIVICHDLDRILAHADRLILLKQGRIIADALPERVLPYLEAHGVRKPNLKLAEMTWLQS